MTDYKALIEDSRRHVIMLYEDRDGDLVVADLLARQSAAVEALVVGRDALQAQLDKVRAARAEHPKCDIHFGGDPVKCGWKRVVLDVDAALQVTE